MDEAKLMCFTLIARDLGSEPLVLQILGESSDRVLGSVLLITCIPRSVFHLS